uniref:CSON006158 protein n=1 Tax=Culicoides sonorensis TaxID=179676 RepID=A0A336LAS4_CULSO
MVSQQCIISALPKYTLQCPDGTININGECISVDVRIQCPAGTIQQGYSCIYQVPDSGSIGVEVRCPPNTVKDSIRNVCIYSPQPLNLVVECPPGTVREGDFCRMNPVEIKFRCSDGSLPVNDYCTVNAVGSGSVVLRCPPGSQQLPNNVCEVRPPQIRYVCPDGRPAINNICNVNSVDVPVPEVVVQCPEGTFKDTFGRCVLTMKYDGVPPKIDFDCPPNSVKRGDVCWVEFRDEAKLKYVCPPGSQQFDSKTCVYQIPPVDFQVYCPPGFTKLDNKCVHRISSNQCSETHQSLESDCPEIDVKQSEPVIHNNNTINTPTNITSHNVHNVNISFNDCSNGAKERVIITNGQTQRIPCPVRVPQPVPVRVPQPYPVRVPVPVPVMQPQSSCCNVPVPQCSAPNMCEYVQQTQCGSACNSY